MRAIRSTAAPYRSVRAPAFRREQVGAAFRQPCLTPRSGQAILAAWPSARSPAADWSCSSPRPRSQAFEAIVDLAQRHDRSARRSRSPAPLSPRVRPSSEKKKPHLVQPGFLAAPERRVISASRSSASTIPAGGWSTSLSGPRLCRPSPVWRCISVTEPLTPARSKASSA